MKVNELITEEMVRGIKGINDGEVDITIGKFATGEGIRVELFLNHSESDIEFIDLARFLFVDAWDYFYKKGWRVRVDDATGKIWLAHINHRGDDSFEFKHYPSRLHAMAAAVKFMWEQEKKDDAK